MSDQADIYQLLKAARPAHSWQQLTVRDGVREGHRTIVITTGPDDAACVLFFNASGDLAHVSVVEAHGEREAAAGPGG